MRGFFCLFLVFFACFSTSSHAEGFEKSDFYKELAALHRTAFVLDYILQPSHFVDVCYTLHGGALPALDDEGKVRLVKSLKSLMEPLSQAVKNNEKAEVLALTNKYYLEVSQSQTVDHKRFFDIYRDKIQKSRAFIAEDLLTKEEVFLSFLQMAQIPGQDYCQNKLDNDKIENLKASWPSDAAALRQEVDAMLSSKAQVLPRIYQESYRRLLQ